MRGGGGGRSRGGIDVCDGLKKRISKNYKREKKKEWNAQRRGMRHFFMSERAG